MDPLTTAEQFSSSDKTVDEWPVVRHWVRSNPPAGSRLDPAHACPSP